MQHFFWPFLPPTPSSAPIRSLSLALHLTYLLDLCTFCLSAAVFAQQQCTHIVHKLRVRVAGEYMRLTLNYKTKQFYIHFCVCSLCFASTRSYFISHFLSLSLSPVCVYCVRRAYVFIRFFSSDNFSVFVHNLFPYGRNLSFVCLHHFYSYDFSVRFQCVWFVSVSEIFFFFFETKSSVWSVDCRLMLLWQLLCSHPYCFLLLLFWTDVVNF